VESGEAGTLVVSKLDRATRSLKDFADLMQRAQKGRWNFVALDLGIDLSSPSGEFMASVMASAAQWERRIISQRTSDVLQAKKAQGQRLGRPSGLSSEVVARIVKERTAGQTWQAIAAGLHADGITASRGGTTWYPSSVKAVYDSAAPSLRSA
jgi:DNA invertase Pin-like site-specific DNA recombinase